MIVLLARNLPVLTVGSRAIAANLVALFEGEFRDAGFVELAEAAGNYDLSLARVGCERSDNLLETWLIPQRIP